MRRLWFVVVALALAGIVAPAQAHAAAPAGYTLRYADEFDGTAVNTNDWYYRITGPYAAGYSTADHATESGGSLQLKYSYEDITGDGQPEYVGGGLMSRRLFGYGYYETRAKLFNTTTGLHTSFWSMGLQRNMPGAGGDTRINQDIDNSLYPEYNQEFEIDDVEHDSAAGMDQGTQVYTAGTSNARAGWKSASQLGINFADWNTYAFEWTPTALHYYINGNLTFTIDLTMHPYSFSPQNIWLTALPYSTNNNPAALPGVAQFDYFRYYSEPITGVSLLGNSGFDTAPTTSSYPGYSVVPGWIENYDKNASNIEDTDRQAGARALRQGATTSFTVTDKQNLTGLPNGTYTLKAWVKSSGGLNSAEMRLLGYGGAELDVNVPATATWTQIQIPNVPVTSNAATIAFSSIGSANQWVLIDSVSFTQD